MPPPCEPISGTGANRKPARPPSFPDRPQPCARRISAGIGHFRRLWCLNFSRSFSLVSPPFLSSEAPGVRLTSRRDPREVQLARTSSLRRTKETARAISLASAPPPKWKTLGMVKLQGDSAEFSAEVEDFGYGQITGETLPNFRQKSEED
ncbi:hypothetical protein Prudu_006500 [Prunus dulcis]|uniref:Uncharacterized protein n=1 Tax=Prunus dulcis TaxID=3755 RepID=A0A4Y1QZT8_PRUDU|nr:hypothetical protein Prudu_006500 [Prunus dulcis]